MTRARRLRLACGVRLAALSLVLATVTRAQGTAAATRPATGVADTVTAGAATTSPGTDAALEARTSAVASGLRCPVCQGLSIQDSPSELSQQMRGVVRDQLAAGKTPDDVRAYFVSKYGEWILLEPKASGFNVLVYLLPALMVLGGLAFITVFVRRFTFVAESNSVDGDPSGDA